MGPVRIAWQRIRSAWNATDTWVSAATVLALALYIADGWWQSVAVCYAASLVPLALLGGRALRDRTLARTLVFGGVVAGLWPFVEGSYVRVIGWWGSYLQPGWKVWDTPIYCLLVGWLTASYVAYAAARVEAMGFHRRTVAVLSGATALILGIIGESLLVRAGMWVYSPWRWSVWHVPLYIPIGYGIGYSSLPWLVHREPIRAAVLFTLLTFALTFGIGYAATWVR